MKIRSKQSPVITDIFLSSIFFNGGIILSFFSFCLLIVTLISSDSSSKLISALFCLLILALGLCLSYRGIKVKQQIHKFRIYVTAMLNDCHLEAIAQFINQSGNTVKNNLQNFIDIGYLPFAELNKTSITFKASSYEELPYDVNHSVSNSGFSKKVRKSGLCTGCHAPLPHLQQTTYKKDNKTAETVSNGDGQDAEVVPTKDDTVVICIYCGSKSHSK